MKALPFLLILFSSSQFAYAQPKLWTAEDRSYLYDNLLRTKNEVIRETKNLSLKQWHYSPSEDSWSIAQVVEHLGLYERIIMQEALVANALPPKPDLFQESRSDEEFINYMKDENPHVALPHVTPLAFMKGIDNLKFFIFGRDLIIEYIRNTDRDLKAQFIPRSKEPNRHRSVHGLMVVHVGHTDRHLRQIARIMSDPKFPSE